MSPASPGLQDSDRISVRLSRKKASFPKRAERYLSAITKLGTLYVMVKEIIKSIQLTEVQMHGLNESVSLVHREQGEKLDDMRDEIRDTLGAFEKKMQHVAPEADEEDETDREIRFLRTELAEAAMRLDGRLARQASEQAGLSRSYGDLTRRIDLMRAGVPASSPTGQDAGERPGLDAMLDSFYARLEDRYRGSREEIGQRLVKYLPDARAAAARTEKPFLDLGCGRGEWLELLRAEKIEATGIDLNEMQLRDAEALGLDVRLGEAAAFLADVPDGTYGMVTAHHLAEHLSFSDLVWMTREAMRVLAPGGMLLYETPNAANIVVGASSFHVDPTHRRLLPAPVLVTLFETVGFHPVETRFLHPHARQEEMVREGRLDPEISGLLFGPQDLAVLGTRPLVGG